MRYAPEAARFSLPPRARQRCTASEPGSRTLRPRCPSPLASALQRSRDRGVTTGTDLPQHAEQTAGPAKHLPRSLPHAALPSVDVDARRIARRGCSRAKLPRAREGRSYATGEDFEAVGSSRGRLSWAHHERLCRPPGGREANIVSCYIYIYIYTSAAFPARLGPQVARAVMVFLESTCIRDSGETQSLGIAEQRWERGQKEPRDRGPGISDFVRSSRSLPKERPVAAP